MNDFTYAFEANKVYAITGPSGCDKTTLLNIIGLLEDQDEGTILYGDIKNPSLKSKQAMLLLRQYISYLFQNYALIDEDSVYDNCLLALHYVKTDNKKEQIESVLRLEDLMDSKVYTLSGGEQQRVALARAMLKPSHVILCDEPTGNLDEANRDEVYEILRSMVNEERCVIIVTHDKELASRCDEVITL